ncbi:MAG: four helix bundle protein [Pirellulaceae bacterium]
MLDHEKLDVYRVLLRFLSWTDELLSELEHVERTRHVRDHLDRASLSAVLNTAEGNGKRRRQVRAKFFDDARGSATECAACLDVLVAKGACSSERIGEGKRLLARAVAMLTKLVELYAGGKGIRETSSEYALYGVAEAPAGSPTEGEDEDEDEIEDDLRANESPTEVT